MSKKKNRRSTPARRRAPAPVARARTRPAAPSSAATELPEPTSMRRVSAAYDAARVDRTRRFRKLIDSADQDLVPDLPRMRSNSRTMVRDDGTGYPTWRTLIEHVVGDGILGQSHVQAGEETGFTQAQADDWNELVTMHAEAFMESRDSDPTGLANGYAYQAQTFGEWVRDGEVLQHRLAMKPGERDRRYRTAFESIDVDRLDDPPGNHDRDLRGGVELDAFGRPVAYWIRPWHPRDFHASRRALKAERSNVPQRWEAYEGQLWSMLHSFRRARTGQRRGVPMFASSFGIVDTLNDAIESEGIAMRVLSKIVLLITQAQSMGGVTDPRLVQQPDGEWWEQIKSGMIKRLQPGEDVKSFNPQRPGSTVDPFLARLIRIVCAQHGLPYELVMRDFGALSFSGQRGMMQQARKAFALLRGDYCDGVEQQKRNAFVFELVVTGRVPMPPKWNTNRAAYYETLWIPPADGYVDPKTDIEAAALAVEHGLSTRQDECAAQGRNWRRNLRANAEWHRVRIAEEKAAELPAGTLAPRSVAAPTAPQPTDEPNDDERPDDELEDDVDAPAPDDGDERDNADDAPASGERPKGGKAKKPPAAAAPADVKATVDAIGVATRSGILTPQAADEERARALLGLPPMGDAVAQTWKAEPVRRPITLAGAAEGAPPPEPPPADDPPPAEPEDDQQ